MARGYLRIALVASAVAALAGAAAAANKTLAATRIFNHLDAYLKVPPAERSHLVIAYYLKEAGQPLTAPVTLIDGGARTPIPLRADGKILKFPTLAQLEKGTVEIGVDEAAKITLSVGLEPILAPAADLDAQELAAAVAQATPAMHKIGGVLALALPPLKSVHFVGVASGEAELADGRRVPLPLVKGEPVYDPAALPNARRIHLPQAPRRLDLE